MKKINFFLINRIALIFSILFVFLFLYSATVNAYTDTSKDYEVSVSRAEIQSEYGIAGENSILFDKNTISQNLVILNSREHMPKFILKLRIQEILL